MCANLSAAVHSLAAIGLSATLLGILATVLLHAPGSGLSSARRRLNASAVNVFLSSSVSRLGTSGGHYIYCIDKKAKNLLNKFKIEIQII